jgi:hypothetical protein
MFYIGSRAIPYNTTWMPIDASTGTCLSLVVLAFTLRYLLALKSLLEKHAVDDGGNKRYVLGTRKPSRMLWKVVGSQYRYGVVVVS